MMGQAWRDAAFLHWAVPPARVASWMPPGVEPDVRDGVTWVGLIPFRMVGAGVGTGPGVPWAGTFLETNVRLYSVDATGRRGIVFCTLECSRLVVVAGAQAAFGLPYRWSRMAFGRRAAPGAAAGVGGAAAGGRVAYAVQGRGRRAGVRSRLELELGDDLPDSATGDDSLATWLTSRWGLHQRHLGRTWYVPNEHGPWPLRAARVVALEDSPGGAHPGLLAATGFADLALRPPDHVLASSGVVTRFGLPGDARRPRP